MSFSPGFCKFESNTTADWLKPNALANQKLGCIQMLRNIERPGELDKYHFFKNDWWILALTFINPSPNKPWFLLDCCTSLFKILWEKKKLLTTSNFSFSHSVFCPFGKLSAIFIKFEIVLFKIFLIGRVQNLSFGKGFINFSYICFSDLNDRLLETLLEKKKMLVSIIFPLST